MVTESLESSYLIFRDSEAWQQKPACIQNAAKLPGVLKALGGIEESRQAKNLPSHQRPQLVSQ